MIAIRPKRFTPALCFLTVLVLALRAGVADAQLFPPDGKPIQPRIPRQGNQGHASRIPEPKPWMRKSIRVGVVVPNASDPVNLSKWFGPRAGLSVWFVTPLLPTLDFDAHLEEMDMPMRESKVRRELGTLDPGSATLTKIGSVAIGFSLHPDREGPRPFVLAAVMLPNISQPKISYTDGLGVGHTLEGSEIFAFDPGYQLGAGLEWRRPGALAAELDVRLWAAPGRTKPAVVLYPVRLMLSIPMPAWM